MAFANFLYLILLLKYVESQDVWDPNKPFLPNEEEKDRVQLGAYINNQQVINIDENIEEHITIAFLAYKGSTEPKITKFTEPSSGANNVLGAIISRNSNEENWELVITMKQDYEGKDDGFRYAFEITVAEDMKRVYLYINNLDDEPPIIEVMQNPCRIEENKAGLSDCEYIIRDADGVMNDFMQYTITGSEGIEAIFEIKNEVELENGMKEWTAVLNVLKCLDYESTALYLLDFTVTDSGGNQGTTKIVVNVIDMPDEPPVWKTIFSSKEFDEKQMQTFQVVAVDGDVEINYPINYKLISDRPEFFSIDTETGIITVNPINRDELQIQIFTFQLIAFEVPDPSSFVDQLVTIIVNDVNDNIPIITVNPETVTIPENTVTKLEFEIQIEDMDLGENGTYTVSLQDSTGNDYHTAFQIVPNQGYQKGTFTISVVNNNLLDYEVELWQNIIVEIHSQEVKEESHFDSKTVKINLDNMNDELPMFECETYTATVFEDIGENEFVAAIFADDRDIDDVVKHSLIGKATTKLFSIDETTGEIRTLVAGAFDYEKETEVIIQVQAEDLLLNVIHRNITQLVISVEDVNDEPPRITLPTNQISIAENQKHGALVNDETTEITAIDDDTTADLLFKIIWEESYATKNGQPAKEDDYKGCIDVRTERNLYSDQVKAVLTINEINKDNTPDYEKFDKLYIALLVEDLDQEIEPKTDKVIITINIEDLNDNYPIFNEDSVNSIKRVIEHTNTGTLIATVFATDADGPEHNTIEYSIRPSDNSAIPPDWIAIDPERGELYVNADGKIDADGDGDRPPFWDLTYTVTATNKDLITVANIIIHVTDINDNPPIVTEFEDVVEIEEASDNNTHVQTIGVTDADRDEVYNTPWFRFGSSTGDEEKRFFSIDERSGKVYVHYKDDKVLDRDYGTPSFSLPIIIGDNYDQVGGRQNIIDKSFMVILLDINNQAPKIKDEFKNLATSENLKKGESVGTIQATDDDEPGTINTKMDFTIIQIKMGDDAVKSPPADLFTISTDKDYASGIGTLSTQYDLKEYYGTYDVTIKTNDFGENPGPLSTEEVVFIHVERYNFNAPKITYPSNDETFYLEMEQTIGDPLNQFNGPAVEPFSATDQQNEKWDIIFKIDEESDPDGIFSMQRTGKSRSRIVLRSTPTEITYKLKIIADCECSGDEPRTDSVTIHIRFIDENSEPYFSDPRVVTEEFAENTTGLDTTKQLPKAYFIGGEEWDIFTIYYELKEDSSGCFEVGSETAVLGLTHCMLDREQQATHTLKVAASKQKTGNNNPDEKSILTVFIKVLDVNDNPPNFESSLYYGGIKPSDDLRKVIVEAKATDLDINDTLTFSMVEESFEAHGEGISNIKFPFIFSTENENTFTIRLNFNVQSNMNGYFLFDITVTDTVHDDTATIKIYVVSDSSRTTFKFENNIDEVEPKKVEIKEILEEQFSYVCNIETISKGTNEDGEPLDTQTDVNVHFINSDNNEPIESSEIEQITSKVEVFTNLRSQFVKEGLYLLSFTDSPNSENMEKMLRNWLIGVSVALGILCLVLIIAFVVKTRSLIRRLNNLSTTKFGSQESGLNRMGMAAPNTNKHAIEGSNPVYNEEKRMPDIDTTSIGSGDSDLIGIEDNPNFEYAPEIRRETFNSMRKEKL